jgi:hypothetical protein
MKIVKQIRRVRNLLRFVAHLVSSRIFRGGWIVNDCLRAWRISRQDLGDQKYIDVMVCIADHFEPSDMRGNLAARTWVELWGRDYQSLTSGHFDSDGVAPQHTWFHRFEYLNPLCISALNEFVFSGLGEIEFLLHHEFDTHDSFSEKIRVGLEMANEYGAMLTTEEKPQPRFGYIAGNSSLDNGSGDESKSGCNTEIRALNEMGCFADFTFPAIGSLAQPKKVNSIYYATSGPKRKSYNTGTDVAVGGVPSGDLMMCQGPVAIDWELPYVETGVIESFALPKPFRLNRWINASVHVQGRPEWKFIKLHTHGNQSRKAWFSGQFELMFSEMENRWTEPPYRLHYVTAREMYNIVKAAEAGHQGNPNDFRDFNVPKPANRLIYCEHAWRLLTFTDELVKIRLKTLGPKRIGFAFSQIEEISGELQELTIHLRDGMAVGLDINALGQVEILAKSALGFSPTLKHVERCTCFVKYSHEKFNETTPTVNDPSQST